MPTQRYDFHGVRVSVESPWRLMADPWVFFRSDWSGKADLDIRFGPFVLDKEGLVALDHTHYVSPERVAGGNTESWGRWAVEARLPDDAPWSLHADLNFRNLGMSAVPYMSAILATAAPLLERLLVHRGFIPLHAAGWTRADGKAVLTVGRAGHRKTTAVLAANRHGRLVLADDKVLVKPHDGTAFPYPILPGLLDSLVLGSREEDMTFLDRTRAFQRLLLNRVSPIYACKAAHPIQEIRATTTGSLHVMEETSRCLMANQAAEVWAGPVRAMPISLLANLWTLQSVAFPSRGIHEYERELERLCTTLAQKQHVRAYSARYTTTVDGAYRYLASEGLT